MNWDKPYTYAEFWDEVEALDVCAHHGFKHWSDLADTIADSPGNSIYEKYLSYCKLADSPLLRALR